MMTKIHRLVLWSMTKSAHTIISSIHKHFYTFIVSLNSIGHKPRRTNKITSVHNMVYKTFVAGRGGTTDQTPLGSKYFLLESRIRVVVCSISIDRNGLNFHILVSYFYVSSSAWSYDICNAFFRWQLLGLYVIHDIFSCVSFETFWG